MHQFKKRLQNTFCIKQCLCLSALRQSTQCYSVWTIQDSTFHHDVDNISPAGNMHRFCSPHCFSIRSPGISLPTLTSSTHYHVSLTCVTNKSRSVVNRRCKATGFSMCLQLTQFSSRLLLSIHPSDRWKMILAPHSILKYY